MIPLRISHHWSSANGLAPNRWQAMVWTYDGLYVSLSLNALTISHRAISKLVSVNMQMILFNRNHLVHKSALSASCGSERSTPKIRNKFCFMIYCYLLHNLINSCSLSSMPKNEWYQKFAAISLFSAVPIKSGMAYKMQVHLQINIWNMLLSDYIKIIELMTTSLRKKCHIYKNVDVLIW